MIETNYLKELDRFQMIIKRRVVSPLSGARASQAVGQGIVFRDYREYTKGDNIRDIDWRLFARTEKLYIKRHEEDRNMTIHIVVDASASMDYGKDPSKFEYAAMIGLGFVYMGMKNNEKFTFSTFSDQLQPFRPKKGMRNLMRILEHLNALKVKGKSEFKKSLFNYKQFVSSKSMIVIISDYMFDLDELKETLLKFSRSEIVVIQVLDKDEVNVNFFGDMILEDSEDKKKMRTYFSLREKQRYGTLLDDHIADIRKVCQQAKADFYTVSTNTPIFETFTKVFRKN
ncbi:DUF58 domain-containing protein [Candidatus Woesearchaeota archaeon]|nr:DUF58 domain-containing protein [Candidatus Woesearchaeota archaeon]